MQFCSAEAHYRDGVNEKKEHVKKQASVKGQGTREALPWYENSPTFLADLHYQEIDASAKARLSLAGDQDKLAVIIKNA